MKYLASLLITTFLFIACKDRERRRCWNCDITYYSTSVADTTYDTVMCNFTQTDIEIRTGIKFEAFEADYDTWEIANCKGL